LKRQRGILLNLEVDPGNLNYISFGIICWSIFFLDQTPRIRSKAPSKISSELSSMVFSMKLLSLSLFDILCRNAVLGHLISTAEVLGVPSVPKSPSSH
jgi:hypothetical protein